MEGKKWNGIGYNKNNTIDFEIKNGNGEFKEYYDNDVIKFEGKYLNGERNGKAKKYYKDSKLKFVGEYKHDKKWNGKVYMYYSDGERFILRKYINGLRK